MSPNKEHSFITSRIGAPYPTYGYHHPWEPFPTAAHFCDDMDSWRDRFLLIRWILIEPFVMKGWFRWQ